MKARIGSKQFEELVARALEDLPEDLAARMSNIEVTIEEEPDEEVLATMGAGTLLGLYQGVPLTSRDSSYYWVLPDRITLYKRNIVAMATSLEDLADIVRKTVIHEVAHHFGIDDDRLDELGWA